MRFFPSFPDRKAREAIIIDKQRNIGDLNDDIAYLEGLTQTHIWTYAGNTPIADVIAAQQALRSIIEAEIAELA